MCMRVRVAVSSVCPYVRMSVCVFVCMRMVELICFCYYTGHNGHMVRYDSFVGFFVVLLLLLLLFVLLASRSIVTE